MKNLIVKFLYRFSILKKKRYKLMYSHDFKAWQIHLYHGVGTYFKGWAANEFTNLDELEKFESIFGGKYNKGKWNIVE